MKKEKHVFPGPNWDKIVKATRVDLGGQAMLTAGLKLYIDRARKALVAVSLHTYTYVEGSGGHPLIVSIECADAEAAQEVAALSEGIAEVVSLDGLDSERFRLYLDCPACEPHEGKAVRRRAIAAEVAAVRVRGPAPTKEKKGLTPKGLLSAVARKAGMEAFEAEKVYFT